MLSTKRVRHELKFRPLEVVEAQSLSPGMRRLVFTSDALRDFESLGFDDHVKLLLPSAPGAEIVPPTMTPAGPRFPEGAAPPVMRDFTPRAFDREAGRLTIEFAIHADGVASRWARDATPGHRAAIGGPRGSLVVPLAYDWHLFAGDESALPAIARRLEELPAGAKAYVFVETASDAERRELRSSANVAIEWRRAEEDTLAAALRAFSPPPGEGFAWAAGEASSMRRVRTALREGHGIDASHSRVSAYWKRGAIAHHEDLA